MSKTVVGAIYGIVMALVIVTLDLLFFRHHFGQRLAANIGVAFVFAAAYWKFIKVR